MREFLMLAHAYEPARHKIAGWYLSEKLDGQRCFWDGGISRGKPTVEIPWANLDRKVKPVASGLWSRYGNVITAPDWFLDCLPVKILLDGELYCGNLQELRTIVSTDVPSDTDWKKVKYIVFDSPGVDVFKTDRINNANFKKEISQARCLDYLKNTTNWILGCFADKYKELQTLGMCNTVSILSQIRLPNDEKEAKEALYKYLDTIVSAGGEGVMLRNPSSIWIPKRVKTLLKVKPCSDSEGTVVGYIDGKDRLAGMLGALIIEWKGRTFSLGTGFDDSERKAELYPIGSMVTFKYVSLTGDGVPREARYKCKYVPE